MADNLMVVGHSRQNNQKHFYMKTKRLYESPDLYVEEVELNEGIAISDTIVEVEYFEEEDYIWVH